jgi:hypothetical protein
MKRLRLALDIVVVTSTSLLVMLIAHQQMTGGDAEPLAAIALQSMHVSLVITTLLYAIEFTRRRQYRNLTFTVVPGLLLIVAVVLRFFGCVFPALGLLVFDFYVILWFTLLLGSEVEIVQRNR